MCHREHAPLGGLSRNGPWKAWLVIALIGGLAACATTKPEPQIVTKEVQVPVPVRCHPDIGPEPDYPDTDAKLKAAPDLFVKVQLLLAGRLERMARDQVKSAALSACAG